MDQINFSVPDMHCEHCEAVLSAELTAVTGVESVDVDLDARSVTIRGRDLSDAALRAAIGQAGYEAA